MNQIQWWAYLHTNGTIQPKRWFGDPLDLIEARESPYVQTVVGPFPADSREQAIEIAAAEFRLGGDTP